MCIHRICGAAFLLLSIFTLGCATPVDVMTARNEIVNNDNRNATESSKEHAAMTTGDMQRAVIDLSAKNNQAISDLQKQFAVELAAEIKKREDAVGVVKDIAIGLSAIGGPFAEGITKQTLNAILPNVTSQIEPVKQTAVAAQQTATDAQKTSADAKTTSIDAQKIAVDAQKLADQAKTALAALDLDQKALKAKYDSLDQGLRDKLASTQSDEMKRITDIQTQLATNKTEAIANLDKLLTDKGVSPEQIRQLHNSSSPQEIIGFILTALTGAGGGVVVNKTLKSRAAAQVDSLQQNDQQQNDRINDMKAKISALDTTAAVRSTHEPRLDSAEAQIAALKTEVQAKADHNRIADLEHALELLKGDIKRQADQQLPQADLDKRFMLIDHALDTAKAESKRQTDDALKQIGDLKTSLTSVNAAVTLPSEGNLGTQVAHVLKRVGLLEHQLGDLSLQLKNPKTQDTKAG